MVKDAGHLFVYLWPYARLLRGVTHSALRPLFLDTSELPATGKETLRHRARLPPASVCLPLFRPLATPHSPSSEPPLKASFLLPGELLPPLIFCSRLKHHFLVEGFLYLPHMHSSAHTLPTPPIISCSRVSFVAFVNSTHYAFLGFLLFIFGPRDQGSPTLALVTFGAE